MPALSPTMEKGNLVKWCMKEGDKVSVGEILFEVETDKATVGYEIQDDGYLAKILIQEGTNDVILGQQVAIIVDEQEDIAAFQNYNGQQQEKTEQVQNQQQQQEQQQQQQQQEQKNYPFHQKLTMPSLSPTMKTGKIKEWIKKEGDKLNAGDILCEIETDKASVGFEIQDTGYLAKIISSDIGIDLEVGNSIAIVVDDIEDIAAFKDYQEIQQDSQPQEQIQKAEFASPLAEQTGIDRKIHPQNVKGTGPYNKITIDDMLSNRVFSSPLAKKTGIEQGLDLKQIKGTGPYGRITIHDVLTFQQQNQNVQQTQKVQQPQQPQQQNKQVQQQPIVQQKAVQQQDSSNPFTEIPVTNMRKTIATKLLESKTTVPHYYLTKSVKMDDVLKLRVSLNKDSKVKISVNDLLIKAASLACRDVPECNSQWHNTFIRKYQNCDLSVAVSTDNGLITPIVFNADSKGLGEIAQDVKNLAEKARNGKLQPNEFIGGTFTISNLGMFGVDHFSAIINPPQSCILAVGKTEKTVVHNENDQENPFQIIQKMTVTLSCDHRVVDGAVGAKWLQQFAHYLEKPYTMML